MIPKITQIDTDQVTRNLRLVDDRVENSPPAPVPADRPKPGLRMRPEFLKAFYETLEDYREAYRYLGR